MEDIKGRVFAAAGLVEYQPGTVVSRTLVKKPTGTITLFAFDKGQGLSEHTAPFDALILALDGEATFHLSGHPHRLKTGDLFLLPAGEPHALDALERFKMALVMIRS